jgi:hypothetical protein
MCSLLSKTPGIEEKWKLHLVVKLKEARSSKKVIIVTNKGFARRGLVNVPVLSHRAIYTGGGMH